MHKSATLTEVATLAGVSVITASRALRGQVHVAASTRKKVLAASQKPAYSPDLLAQTMRGASTKLIGVFLNGFGSMVVHNLLASIDIEARRLGYDLMVFNAESFDSDRAGPLDMMMKLCDGAMWLLPNVAHSLLERLEQGQFPCVLVNFAARPTRLPTVAGANHAGARRVTDHLIGLGHRKIAFITGSVATGQSQERQRGYEDALRDGGIAVRADYIIPGTFEPHSGVEGALSLLALPEPPSAIFCANDGMAISAMQMLVERGVRVPGDMSVAGFDDVPAAAMITPGLTTVRQPLEEIGTRAVSELVRIISGHALGPSRVELPSQLIVRDSTGPAPKS